MMLLATACTAPPEPPRNLLLVSIDTLRADHLGCHGYERPTSPNIDAFCAQSAVFENTVAHAPSTLLSHTSLFSSRIPQHHGTSHIRNIPVPETVPTLATVLGEAGFATASFNSGGQLAAEFGLGRGFEVYESGEHAFAWIVEKGLDWLDRRPEKPFFLFLHSYEVHLPYTPAPEFLEPFDQGYEGELPDSISIELVKQINRGKVVIDEADLDHIRATYDGGIRSMDAAFGTLIEGLRQRGLLDDTLVVLTSDHGEEFDEHGKVAWHSHTLYEELLRVPFVLRLPAVTDREAVRVAPRVRSIDIAPTALDALGIPAPEGFQGRSLLPWILGSEDAEALPSAESVAYWDTAGETVHEALTVRNFKYHDGELFDLRRDPGEQTDLAQQHPELVRRLELRLRRLVESEEAIEGQAIELDPETLEQLRALGYID